MATCLDTTLLFAAGLEAVGLNPVIVFQKDHSFIGFWLSKKSFPNLVETDAIEIRKALAGRELITFETTKITFSPPASFEDAISTARFASTEAEEDRFVGAIDIARARSSQIRPLASHQREAQDTVETAPGEASILPLPPEPDFSSMPTATVEEKPTTATGRIERWQRKLLDLSLRNRLLNYKPSKQTLPLICPDTSKLEDLLADNIRIKVISLPEQNPLGGRDKKVHLQKTGQDLDVEFAKSALLRNEICSPLEKRELNAQLTTVYRKANSDLMEGGTNTLFLAIGFLKWKKTPEDPKTYRAPLLLVPVTLKRRSASSIVYMVHHEDEVRFNSTLLEMLKQDFALSLPQFEGDLPRDESGVDVPLILEMMRRAVREVPGFEIAGNEVALTTFSFAKYLMWKDLTDRLDQLKQNRVVRHLIENPDKVFETATGSGIPEEHQIDKEFHPKDFLCPLPADSSQLASVAAVKKGHDLVLIGPPGTGKSQTIANMIAQCLADGKTVLFIAEKTAALNVVYKRLQENGLGDFCLELHSNKADRKSFLSQMNQSWLASSTAKVTDWVQINEQLKLRQDQLSQYVTALHRKHENGWSVFDAMGLVCYHETKEAPEITWDDQVRHDQTSYQRLVASVEDAALTFKHVDHVPALKYVTTGEWSMAWERNFLERAKNLVAAAGQVGQQVSSLCQALEIRERRDVSISLLEKFELLAHAVLKTAKGNIGAFLLADLSALEKEIDDLQKYKSQFDAKYLALGSRYPVDNLKKIRCDQLEEKWREANAALWPASAPSVRKVRKLLQTYAHENMDVDVEADLPLIRELQTIAKLAEASQTLRSVTGPVDLGTDTTDASNAALLAKQVKSAIARVGTETGEAGQITGTMARHITSPTGNESLTLAATRFLEVWSKFKNELRSFSQASGAAPFELNSDTPLEDITRFNDELKANRSALQAWTSWCKFKREADAMGLAQFATALEEGQLSHDKLVERFELSYARWWLPLAVDADLELRTFQRFKHEDVLKDFRDIDDAAMAQAAKEVQQRVRHNLPSPEMVPKNSELGLLRHQINLARPRNSIRNMVASLPETFPKLAPCLLMSPLSIAQYLPTKQALYDVVIFDEASQITTWDAVGAIARARQTVIVGDPMQLPPTNFFGRTDDGDDDEELAFFEADLESILDEARASGIPTKTLRWHYRSRDETLIQFSNYRYYDNKLITFPSPSTKDGAVSLRHVDDIYDRGKSRTNRIEADAIVRECVDRMLTGLDLEEEQRETIGIVTFNTQQQTLLQDLLDAERQKNPDLEWFFSNARFEPVFVKNIESIQGDERDLIIFSIAFAKDIAGKMSMNFGALNRAGGHRRLNVAVTRARSELLVFSSITADDIDASRSSWQGVADLKLFLDYADRGIVALAAEIADSQGGFESPFEQAVAEALQRKGWEVRTQIGASGFRIDLGIVHPNKPGVDLSRFRSAPGAHLSGDPFKSQGAFPA